MLGELTQDVVYSLRTLRRNAGFTAVVVSALALGIGANTAIFTLIDAVLLRQLPVTHPEQLVVVGNPARTGGMSYGSARTDMLSYPLYRDIRAHNDVFTDVLATGRAGRLDAYVDSASQELEHPRGRYVSGNYFSVLGVTPMAGRAFDTHMDDVTGSSPAVVISHGYWTRRFHNDRSAIGRPITIGGIKLTVVGVMPSSFTGEVVGDSPDLWLPLSMFDALHPHRMSLDDRSASWLLLMGRLKPGVTLAQAQQRIPDVFKQQVIANSSSQLVHDFEAGEHKYYVADGSKGLSRVRDSFHAPLLTLMFGVALLLCIICANVANLLLARAVTRGREMSVRLALGADRSRLVRQLLTESGVLAMLSALVGLIVAWWGSRVLLTMAADGGTMTLRLGMDLPVLAFTVATSVLAVALFGLAPALRASRVDLASTMRASSSAIAGSALGRRGLGRSPGALLVAAQVALSVVLLMGATMLVRSLRNAQTTDVGLDRDHLVVVDVDATARGYTNARIGQLAQRLRERLAAVPGVAAVSFSENGIFSGTDSHTSLQIPGFQARQEADTVIGYDMVGAAYLKAIGAKVIAGRDIETRDEGSLPRVAVVNHSLADFYFHGQNAVGKYLRFNDSVNVQIVGVAADTHDQDLRGKPDRRAYFPFVHAPDSLNLGWPGSVRFEVRTSGDPKALVQPLRRAALSLDPALPIDGVDPLTQLMKDSISEERLLAKVATAFGVLALLLAAIGLYGVMTYAITRRTSEIGLRIALGAQRSNVVSMVLFDALRVVAVGVVVGVPLALVAVRLLRTQLFEVALVDPASIVVAVVVLTVSAVVAVLLPARKAASVSPNVALRAE
jgi:predicted permease